jgi:capsid portal protein
VRGSKTPIKKVEKVKAIAVLTDNIAEAARQANLPYNTANDIVNNNDEFVKIREQEYRKYVIKTWANIQAISDKLTQFITSEKIDNSQLRDLTGALKDLRQTVENVVNNIHIGDNIQNNNIDPVTLEKDAKEYLESIGYTVTKS